MKQILVPTDFSDHAEAALKIAAQIASKNNSEILLLHMLELPNQMSDAISASASIPEVMLFIQKAKDKLRETQEKEYLKNIKVSHYLQFEKAHEGILSFSQEYNIDLIVMGSHGVTGIDEVLIGSNTEKIVRSSNTPVLVIKKETKAIEGTNFIFASDFSKENEKPFLKMIEFAKIFDAHIHLVLICSPNSFKTTAAANKIMANFISNMGLKNYSTHIYNDTNIEKGILNFAESVKADLIGLCTHGRTGMSHFFSGSIGEDIANHAHRPVITFKI
ncbi:universal stress protein [Flavobacterium crassostreae]|uniref:Universal stress protein UspA n=1 Tax=Flavobacterium crassostreae TaxID=1763534 RepID=A0A1B9DXC0_9FLAO|nr:universal stress protein [Flavobacterium crassostreae]OCB74325.1 universal stress protein UspA [Flavobacterium crassostreae]